MGKYNFNYEKLNTLEKENADLKASNARLCALNEQLCARLDKVEELLWKGTKKAEIRSIVPHLDPEQYAELFGLEITETGALISSDNKSKMSDWFSAFRQCIMRTILPIAHLPENSRSGEYRLIGKSLKALTGSEYEIVIETFQSVTDLLFYAKNKLNKLTDNSNDNLQED